MGFPMSQSTTTNRLSCGACQHDNADAAQFCAGCGHSLYESCAGCGNPVTLMQKFCVTCGKDLVAHFRGRITSQETRLAEAIAAAKKHDYNRAIGILEVVSEQSDFRFADIRDRARLALTKVKELRDQVVRQSEQRMANAAEEAKAQNFAKVVDVLSAIPETLLDEDSRARLKNAQHHLNQHGSLKKELEAALAAKAYEQASSLTQQLLELQPESRSFHKMAIQLGERLLRTADKRFHRQDYAGASRALHAIVDRARGDEYKSMLQRIETTRWLSEQFDGEPLATGTLGRLAMRFATERPQDGRAAELVKDLSVAVKAKRATVRDGFAAWRTQGQSWLGGRLGVLSHPQAFDFTAVENRPATLSDCAIALGLALHGLSLGRFSGNLVAKKGMLSKLTFSKATAVWGVDVGSSAIRAVRMQLDKNASQPSVTHIHCVTLDQPTCRRGGRPEHEPLAEAMAKLLGEIDLDGTQVWSNLPSCESVSRFCELPPVKNSQAEKLIVLEAKSRVPIPTDDLEMLSWLGPLDPESRLGRPLAIVAATKLAVRRRVDLLGSAGLTVDGLIPESVALVDFAAFEFADFLKPPVREDDSTTKKGPRKSDEPMPQMPTLAIVDAGAAKTTLMLVSPVSMWFWTQESGGEEMTTIVARLGKLRSEQAEQAKRNLAALDEPDVLDQGIAERQMALRMRLIKLDEEAKRTFGHLQPTEVWVVGGAHLQHAFYRRILLASGTNRS